jgi:hypothetical protein
VVLGFRALAVAVIDCPTVPVRADKVKTTGVTVNEAEAREVEPNATSTK